VPFVPGLIFLFGFSQHQAQGTSLAVLSLPILVFAAARYYEHGHVHLPEVGWIALGIVGGAFFGAVLANNNSIPPEVLRVAFGVVLLYVGFMFVLEPGAQQPMLALPAGLLAVLTAILAWVLRRKPPPGPIKQDPPDQEVEYHL